MIVAGRLLATVRLHQDPDDPDDEFNSCLRGTCSLDKMATGWLIEETQHRLNGRVGRLISKKMIGAGPWTGRILIVFSASVEID